MNKNTSDVKKIFGKVVRKNRKHMGYTQLDLETSNIISRKALSDIENAKSSASIETVAKLIKFLNIPFDDIKKVFYIDEVK